MIWAPLNLLFSHILILCSILILILQKHRNHFLEGTAVHVTWPWITTPFTPRLYATIILRIILEKSGLSSSVNLGSRTDLSTGDYTPTYTRV